MKKLFEMLFVIVIIAIFAALLTGCNSTSVVENNKSYGADGKLTTEQTITRDTTAPLSKASYNVVNQTTAFRIKTTPDTSTASTSWIELIFGTSVTPIQVVKPVKADERTPAMYTKTVQTSIWADIFGTNISSGTESYTAAAGETAEETATRISALRTGSITANPAASAKPESK